MAEEGVADGVNASESDSELKVVRSRIGIGAEGVAEAIGAQENDVAKEKEENQAAAPVALAGGDCTSEGHDLEHWLDILQIVHGAKEEAAATRRRRQ